MTTNRVLKSNLFPARSAMRIAVFYVLAAALWILFSDTLVDRVISDSKMLTWAQTIKGWMFVIVTGTLLYIYIRMHLQRIKLIEDSHETTIKEQFHQMAILFDSFNAIIYVADLNNYELLYVNKYAQDIFGTKWRGVNCYHYLQKGQAQPCDFCTNHLLSKNGEPGPAVTWEFQNTANHRWYECLDKAIHWTNGRLVRLEIAIDVTERKELERTKDDMLSAVSHEMRTPLTAITGFSELLLDDPEVSNHIKRHLQIIFKEAEKMGDLVNTFLDVRRYKTDRSRTAYTTLQVIKLINEGLKNTRDCSDIHQINVTCADSLTVFGNQKELVQAINQLVTNACRFSPNGGPVSIEAYCQHNQAIITVSDQGVGIPTEEYDQIFQAFYRIDRGDTRCTRGVGLGLAVVKEIIELHGGRIWLESFPGRGSSFHIALPEPRALKKQVMVNGIASPGNS